MIKHKIAARGMFLLSLCLLTSGTFATLFQVCRSGPVVYYTTCQSLCQGDDFTCTKHENLSYWCESGANSCTIKPKQVYVQQTVTRYFCTPSGGSACTCIAGPVIEENIVWVPVNPC